MKIRKGDKVKVILGKDRGKEGKIEFVLGKDKKIFVTDANMYKRHVRKMKDMEGGILTIPKPMDISNVALICPNCNKVTRVGFKLAGTEKLRICRKCTKTIGLDEGKGKK